jgi:lipopolysaccharide assembly protein A
MRWVHLTIVVLFVAAMIVFVIQNREVITMAFLGFIRAALALVAAGIYVLGAITGGSLFALLRRSMEAARPARA